MIQELKDIPNTLVAFRVTQSISKEDFDTIILPAVVELIKRLDKLNFLLVLDQPSTHFAIGSWLKDAMERLNHVDKWNRSAIVCDPNELNSVKQSFGTLVPGEFKIYTSDELDTAITWVGEQGIIPHQEFQKEVDASD